MVYGTDDGLLTVPGEVEEIAGLRDEESVLAWVKKRAVDRLKAKAACQPADTQEASSVEQTIEWDEVLVLLTSDGLELHGRRMLGATTWEEAGLLRSTRRGGGFNKYGKVLQEIAWHGGILPLEGRNAKTTSAYLSKLGALLGVVGARLGVRRKPSPFQAKRSTKRFWRARFEIRDDDRDLVLAYPRGSTFQSTTISLVGQRTVRFQLTGRPEADCDAPHQIDRPPLQTFTFRALGLAEPNGRLTAEGKAFEGMLSNEGQLQAGATDPALLELRRRICHWFGVQDEVIVYDRSKGIWRSRFKVGRPTRD